MVVSLFTDPHDLYVSSGMRDGNTSLVVSQVTGG
jgi:hypothetical protein